jgi:hypothetical protein
MINLNTFNIFSSVLKRKATSKEILASIIIIGTFLYIERNNILYCGSVLNKTLVTQLQEFIPSSVSSTSDTRISSDVIAKIIYILLTLSIIFSSYLCITFTENIINHD